MSRTTIAALVTVFTASIAVGSGRADELTRNTSAPCAESAPAQGEARDVRVPQPGPENRGTTAAPAAARAPSPQWRPEPERVPAYAPPVPDRCDLSGPRFGTTFLSDGIVSGLRDDYGDAFEDLTPVVSQFGWQFETQIGGGYGSHVALLELVGLVGGLEQGVFIPSITGLVGIRSRGGVEIGLGPNVTPAGTAIAIAGGMTIRSGALNFPINVAVVPSRSGVRVSLLAGFTTR